MSAPADPPVRRGAPGAPAGTPPRPARPDTASRRFLAGAGLVWGGFRMWRLRPGVMALGMLPALIVSVVFMAALLTLAWFSDELAAAITPFADDWAEAWQRLVRIFVSGGLLFAAAAIAAYSFTAVTLIVGDPFYERVWKAAEEELGGFQEVKLGFWRSAGDAIKLLLRSIGAAILVSLVGLIPLLGQILGPVLGAILAGHILARELTNRPLEARGIASADRKALLKGNR
ncbi:MAG: EI24 domain-containing protein, partial [Microbacteriaceae bacterium]